MEFFTVGVYNSTGDEFFEKLEIAAIDVFCDIRQRRGVRGAKYSFVNSLRLQEKLGQLEIAYLHEKKLAPIARIREVQKRQDSKAGQLKRERTGLSAEFCSEYESCILGKFDFEDFFRALEGMAARKVALFCVEEQPHACHRSLVGAEIQRRTGRVVSEL